MTKLFAEDAVDSTSESDEVLAAALAAIGSWSDLAWEETVAALERIRHESKPTPPIDDP